MQAWMMMLLLSGGPEPRTEPRFDQLVRDDFFAGFGGDAAAFARAMETTEDALAKNPKHAEAMVWHGCGTLFQSGQAYRNGDYAKGGELWGKGMKEMDDAVALAPDDIGVLIPRATTLGEMARYVPDRAEARKLLETAVADYEKTFALEQTFWDRLSVHSRGELLSALGDGWHRLGDDKKAAEWFRRVTKECKGSVYAKRAQLFLRKKADASTRFTCLGCHVD